MTGIDLTKADASPDPYLLECYPNVTKSAHTGVILEIRRERTVELVMEPPYRSWDLFRWNEFQVLQLQSIRKRSVFRNWKNV